MSVEVVSFGCRLNGAEAETMRGLAVGSGFADLAVVNTCAVTAEASRRSAQAVRRAVRTRPGTPVVATGCAAEIDPAAFSALPGVTLLGNGRKTDPASWAALRAGPAAGLPPEGGGRPGGPRSGGPRLPASDAGAGRVRAFVEVQNGCDHDCTFCTIPRGRGRARSVPAARAVEAVRDAVRSGAREVVLTGVDVTSYEAGGGMRLGGLVRAILAGVPELDRLRLSSIDSVEADPDLLEALRSEPRLMPHLHLSLQSGDDLVLKRMKRRHGRADAVRFCREVRQARPGIVFGADLIAGFPTETAEMFGRSLSLVEECGLTYLHVFPFSARPGTPAARMPAVPDPVVRERARRLREAGAVALDRHLSEQLGSRPRVLVEGSGLGRTEGFAPVRFPEAPARGTLCRATIVGRREGCLLAA